MKGRQSPPLFRCGAAILSAVLGVGCASLTDRNEAIIRVQTRQNPAKAQRLTLHGVKAMNSGQVEYAFEKFAAAIDADEAYGPAHNNVGLLHYDQGNLFQAVLAFEQAMELMPYDPAVYYNLALTLESAGKVHEAMDLYWQAVEMDPVNPVFLGNLVRLRVRLGENNPELVTQLQDLLLIETRPDWRSWADHQLAIELNPALDRGPETPEFNTGRRRGDGQQEDEPAKNIIDLTPASEPAEIDDSAELPPPRHRGSDDPPAPRPPEFSGPAMESKPLPIRDEGPLESLPPSIDLSPDRELRDFLR
jgi:tetratricopeptide (TPR) repeat protein